MRSLLLVGIVFSLLKIAYAQEQTSEVKVVGKVLNERNMQLVTSKVKLVFIDLTTGKKGCKVNTVNGAYKASLPSGGKYSCRWISKGFYSGVHIINLTVVDSVELVENQNIILAPLLVGQIVRLKNIEFEEKTDDLLEKSFAELDSFVKFLKKNKKFKIELAAHTDNVGGLKLNMELSQERVDFLAAYLKKNKIKEGRIVLKAYGPTRPMGFNNSNEGRELNNRIEFKILSLDYKK